MKVPERVLQLAMHEFTHNVVLLEAPTKVPPEGLAQDKERVWGLHPAPFGWKAEGRGGGGASQNTTGIDAGLGGRLPSVPP